MQQSIPTHRRGRGTAAQVAQTRAAYLAAPNHCLNCNAPIWPREGEKISETLRRKFCTRSCAASYNNSSAVAPKKKAKPRFCADCGTQVATPTPDSSRILCPSCTDALLHRLPYLTRDQAGAAGVRRHIRQVLADRPRVCRQCGYATHVEAIHLRPIDDFPPSTPLSEIDDPANLAYLCPNHRWEYEHGLLALDPMAVSPAHIAPHTPQRTHAPSKRPPYIRAVASR